MLVRSATKRLEIPHEPGEHMTLRRLSWRQLDLASDVASAANFEKISSMGPQMVAALRQSGEGEADPGTQYDKATILHLGITEWTYDAEVTPDNIDLLDQQTAEWAFNEILKLNLDDQKNG